MPAPAPQAIEAPPPAPVARKPKISTTRRSPLPRFHVTAADHMDQEQRDVHAQQRLKLRNAFVPSQPVMDPRMFSGRTGTLESIIRSVEDQRLHIVVFGDRGLGKTSMLHMLSLAAREARYIVIYISCGASTRFEEAFRSVAAELPLLYHRGVSPISSGAEIGTSLADLLPAGSLTPRQFAEAAAKLVGTRVLIVLDEFDRVESAAFRRDIAELIKTLSDISARVQLIIGGVANDLADLVGHVPSIRRSLSAFRLSAMSDEEVRDIISHGEQNSGMTFSPSAVNKVVEAALGSPYLCNLICHIAAMTALDDRRTQVEVHDVVSALAQAVEDLGARLPSEVVAHVERVSSADNLSEAAKAKAMTISGLEAAGLVETSDPRYLAIADALTPYLHLRNALRTASSAPLRGESMKLA
jgi:Cdc6-like AAA superfamily ATPase